MTSSKTTLISLYTHWKQACAADNLDGYVHRILVRRFIDQRRSRWTRVTLRNQLFEVPEAPAISYEERHVVTAALGQLPKGQRAVLVLRFYSDLSVEATAQALGCSEGNVKSQCSRGLAALRAALGVPPARRLTAANRLTAATG
jgi:RNA polymerase sigma factor (sigma-70 family)